MCYQNYTQHNGCGHIGEAHAAGFTLCDAARHRLNKLRGPNSPPLSPPPSSTFAAPKRSSSTRRFFSLSGTLSRSSTSASKSSRRSVSSPSHNGHSNGDYLTSGSNISNGGPVAYEHELPLHQIQAVKCAVPIKRTQVSSKMDVCKECKKWIREMRFMLERYDKTGNVRGLAAFEEFLRERGEGGGESECDMTVPIDGGLEVDGFKGIQPRQAIIMGYPDNDVPRGLGTFPGSLNGKEY